MPLTIEYRAKTREEFDTLVERTELFLKEYSLKYDGSLNAEDLNKGVRISPGFGKIEAVIERNQNGPGRVTNASKETVRVTIGKNIYLINFEPIK